MNNFQSYSTFQAPAEPAASSFQAIRVHDAVNRVSINDGALTELHTSANDRGHTGQLNPYHGTESVFASATTTDGMPVTAILPDTLVTIGGVQAPVSFWVQQGMVKQSADGTFAHVGDAPVEVPQVDTGDYAPINSVVMERINDAMEPCPQEHLDSVAGIGVGVAVGRLDDATLTQKFAEVSGIELAESHERLVTIKAAYQAQADDALTTRYGLSRSDLPEFYAWARAKHQGQTQEAIQKQIHTHDVSGYRALATQWLADVPPSLNAIKAAGLSVREQGQGHEVFVRGNWMSPAAAAKAGFI